MEEGVRERSRGSRVATCSRGLMTTCNVCGYLNAEEQSCMQEGHSFVCMHAHLHSSTHSLHADMHSFAAQTATVLDKFRYFMQKHPKRARAGPLCRSRRSKRVAEWSHFTRFSICGTTLLGYNVTHRRPLAIADLDTEPARRTPSQNWAARTPVSRGGCRSVAEMPRRTGSSVVSQLLAVQHCSAASAGIAAFSSEKRLQRTSRARAARSSER